MKFTVNTNNFINFLLTPVSKIAENLSLTFLERDNKTWVKTFVNSSDNSIILFSELEIEKIDSLNNCVIPDCKTFLRLFSNIDEEKITLDIQNNVIKYKNATGFSFKYFLLDESYLINKKSLSEEKINALTYDTTFVVSKQKFSDIIKYNSIIPDAEKLYVYSDSGKIMAKIGDEQKTSTNEITTEFASSFNGKEISSSLPLDIKNLLMFSFAENEINISINSQLKIFRFQSGSLVYIVSGLVR